MIKLPILILEYLATLQWNYALICVMDEEENATVLFEKTLSNSLLGLPVVTT